MKKCIAILLLLCLVLPTWAYAAKNVPLARWGDEGIDDQINWQFAHKDELVLVGRDALYTRSAGEKSLQTWSFADGGAVRSALAAFTGGKEIYFVVPDGQKAVLSRVVLENGAARLEALHELDWSPIHTDDEEERLSLVRLDRCAYMDGYLYGYSHETSGTYAIPVSGGETEVLEDIWDVAAICPYKDGQVLFVQLSSADDLARLTIWDMDSEEIEELGNIPYTTSISYDKQEDRLLYLHLNALYAYDIASGESSVLNDTYSTGGMGTLLPDGYFASTGYTSTALLSTDPDAIDTRPLSIRTMFCNPVSIRTAREDYALERPDVELTLYDGRGDTGGDGFVWYVDNYSSSELVEELLTKSTEYDIYVGSLSYDAIDAVYNRGYMYPITGSEKIDALFASMRPVFADALSMDGAPIAIPLETKGISIAYNNRALQLLDMTAEDMPTNWLDMLDILPALFAKLEETNSSVFYANTEEEIRGDLLAMIFRTYENYVEYAQQQNPNASIDNAPLLAVLEKLDSMDLSAFVRPDVMYGFSDPLLGGASCTASNGGSAGSSAYETPALISLTPDDPCLLPVSLTVAFINPYSENKDLAVEFLERTLDHVENGVLADLMIEEVPPKNKETYEKVWAAAERTLENAKARLAQETDQANLPRLISDVYMYQMELDRLNMKYYEFDPAFAQWYRDHADNIIVLHYNMLTSNGRPSDEIKPIYEKFRQGAISAAEMVQEFERKVDMMLREGY